MAGVEVGSGGRGKRAMNAEINMVPFVDLLLVTVAFLLVTAVWVSNAGLKTNAQVPSTRTTATSHDDVPSALDVRVGDDDIALVWKQGNTVVSEHRVPRSADRQELASAFAKEWAEHGGHKSESDQKVDQAVIHTADRLPFKELVSVMDALYAEKRTITSGDGHSVETPVFNATFSVR